MLLAGIPLDDLAQRCEEQTQQYNRRQASDAQFCFELLRRALAEGLSDAFTHICRIYQPQILRWVYRHTSFERTGETAEYFTNAALTQFYFALRGPKFERIPSLGQALGYLKACVHSVVAQYSRDQQKTEWVPLDEAAPGPTLNLSSNVEAGELWAHLCRLLPHENDQRLAYAVFVLALKPSQVLKAYSGVWKDERQISVDLYRIRRRLRKDQELRQGLGLQPVDIEM